VRAKRIMDVREVNFDGLIGPTHHFGGLSFGNIASSNNAGEASNPREAALQGLSKMEHLLDLGLDQAVLPPLPRPDLSILRTAGFTGSDQEMLEQAAKQSPVLLSAAYSASAMWAANAATVSPSADTLDGRLHFSVANLSTMLHRSFEGLQTARTLKAIFSDIELFCVHEPLAMHSNYSDEGAANHTRLAGIAGAQGLEIFIYGRDTEMPRQTLFPARQTRLACETVARRHQLRNNFCVYHPQSVIAIDAGAFHNDVVAVGSGKALFFHEFAFESKTSLMEEILAKSNGLFDPDFVEVSADEVPLADAISSYLFNSQLLQIPGKDRLILLAPTEVENTRSTREYCERLIHSNGSIEAVEYIDVRQSMRNGGGPACLRLRVVMTAEERSACHQDIFLNKEQISVLKDIVSRTYRDRVTFKDLSDIQFARDCWTARSEILDALSLSELT